MENIKYRVSMVCSAITPGYAALKNRTGDNADEALRYIHSLEVVPVEDLAGSRILNLTIGKQSLHLRR